MFQRLCCNRGLKALYLHRLTGNRKGYWSVTVSGNWLVTFGFEDGRAVEVSRLAEVFGSTAETWLGIQMAYDQWQAHGAGATRLTTQSLGSSPGPVTLLTGPVV